mmetsp:Transcript_85518/g.228755  ORF Transcript_85518/g.228755 Transcript_85518/m.228755 type:complete len:291 (+) Transcript_85518:3-875(+)
MAEACPTAFRIRALEQQVAELQLNGCWQSGDKILIVDEQQLGDGTALRVDGTTKQVVMTRKGRGLKGQLEQNGSVLVWATGSSWMKIGVRAAFLSLHAQGGLASPRPTSVVPEPSSNPPVLSNVETASRPNPEQTVNASSDGDAKMDDAARPRTARGLSTHVRKASRAVTENFWKIRPGRLLLAGLSTANASPPDLPALTRSDIDPPRALKHAQTSAEECDGSRSERLEPDVEEQLRLWMRSHSPKPRKSRSARGTPRKQPLLNGMLQLSQNAPLARIDARPPPPRAPRG